MAVADKTQRSDPGQARGRRQYNKYGQAVQQRPEGFVSGAKSR